MLFLLLISFLEAIFSFNFIIHNFKSNSYFGQGATARGWNLVIMGVIQQFSNFCLIAVYIGYDDLVW